MTQPSGTKTYQRQKLQVALVKLVLSLSTLVLFAICLGPILGRWLRASGIENPWLQLLIVATSLGVLLEAITLPLAFWSGFVLEHRHQLSNETLGHWIGKRLKGYLVGGVLGLVMLFGLYALLWLTGSSWWLWTALAWLGFSLILGQFLPVIILPLFYKVTRLEDATLAERFRTIADGTGLTVEGVYRLHLSAETKKANAALAGLGSTRRVLLGDTLLEQFTPDEIAVVFAHEVGHHVYQHIWKNLALGAILILGGLWLVDLALTAWAVPLGYEGLLDPAALPLILLVLTLFGLVLQPIENAISRYYETQCDTYALRRTGLKEAYRSAFEKLASINKSDPSPHPMVVWWFYDHPPIADRLALADRVGI